MSNFAFLPSEFEALRSDAARAEGHVHGDPRSACFYTRRALEAAVHWLYRYEPTLRMPYDRNLGALLHEPTFQNLLPEAIYQKARLIQKVGNQAVHSSRDVGVDDSMPLVRELHHICYWLMRTYFPDASREGAGWKEARVPQFVADAATVSRQELEALEAKLAAQAEGALQQQRERDAQDSEMQALRAQLAEKREAAESVPDTHDYTEAETRRRLIDVELRRAGWPLDQARDREYEVTGMPNEKGIGFVDYVLWGDDGEPLALVEAKRTMVDPDVGRQQAKLYADCLEAMHGQRPFVYTSNGYVHRFWDDLDYPVRQVGGFHTKEALSRLRVRRSQRKPLAVSDVNGEIAGRYYQKRVIGSVFEQFTTKRRKALLVMATGTGKTRTAIALVDALQRAGWVKRALFLADRTSLVQQAVNAFKTHLPDSSPVNLVTERNTDGRVYVSTYPTMLGLIDQTEEQQARFGIGAFDLVIIDEAHRSVYRKYRAIFEYFDSLLLGLTATPRDEVDRNTYDLFELEPGVPTDAYELDKAIDDGYLVPPNVSQVDMRFPREGIVYDELTDDEKAEWESIDWGDEEPGVLPDRVEAPAINNWLFNTNTVDLVLQYLMEHGHKVEGGDRLGKTIIFARNQHHAEFIEKRFTHHYPQYRSQFARVVTSKIPYAQTLIDDFGEPDKAPHIAISVDMLDTGIDVPEVVNLVFFKPVYSRIKFWQMIGRGTRIRPDLFGPGLDKTDFQVFDFCFNFEYFRANPEGRATNDAASLGTRLFRARVQLLGHLQNDDTRDTDGILADAVADVLHGEVASMSPENFIVRRHLETVETFRERDRWRRLDEADRLVLIREVAELPTTRESDAIESRLFDLTSLRMQLAVLEGDTGLFEAHRARVVEIAVLLEDKRAIPAVAEQLDYLARLQEPEFWQDIDVIDLEDLRERLRPLVPLLDRQQRKVVYTNFIDEITGVRPETPIDLPAMTGAQYAKKVRDYLSRHTDHLVVQRLRTNQPLTPTDLEGLEQTLVEIAEADGERLLHDLMEREEAPSLAWFVRSLVGLDRAAAQAAFADYLNDRTLSPAQMRFVELIVERLTVQGVMEPSALYEPPFRDLHTGGPEGLFADRSNVVDGLFETIDAMHDHLQQDRKTG